MVAGMKEDHRNYPRRRTLKGGRIAFHEGRSTITCTIRDLSLVGAKLEITSSVGIPDQFILALDDHTPMRRCVVRRRTATSLGVEFVTDEPPQ
jgi:hypothetical protein